MKIINLLEEKNETDELFENLKNRYISHKFIYFDEGAKGYYANKLYEPVSEDFIKFVKEEIPTNEKVAFISLGCGNSKEESRIFSDISANITYFGIDASSTMLDLSAKSIQKFDISSVLIKGDFTTDYFRNNFIKMLDGYDRKIYYMAGFTFGNFDSEIVSILYNLMEKGDIFIFYCLTIVDLYKFKELFTKDFKGALKNKGKMAAYFEPMKKFNLPKDSGKMIMDVIEENMGSYCFQFSYLITRKVRIKHNNEKVEFIPGEKIKIQQIRVHDFDKFIAFFKAKNFDLIDMTYNGIYFIYSFQKK